MTGLRVRVAGHTDLDSVVRLQAEAVRWIGNRGLDQWQPAQGGRQAPEQVQRRIADAISRGECYVAVEGSRIVATITVDEFADPEFWQECDEPSAALYVHRMIVARNYSGRGIGEALIDFASEIAARRGKKWLRLDAWRTNLALHRYYLHLGFKHVRTVSLEHRGSGALFQRPARRRLDRRIEMRED